MSTYTKEMLESISIFAIRDIAKEVGISSPTKKNKAELIDLILKISSGEMEPPEAPRRGRPKKPTELPPQAAEPAKASEQPRPRGNRYGRDNAGRYESKQAAGFHDDKRGGEPDQMREGFLEINPDGYGFLRVRNCECNEMDAYVPSVKIKQYGLRKGDKVRAMCKTLQEGKPSSA